jgi:hypothetical protein
MSLNANQWISLISTTSSAILVAVSHFVSSSGAVLPMHITAASLALFASLLTIINNADTTITTTTSTTTESNPAVVQPVSANASVVVRPANTTVTVISTSTTKTS